MPDVLWVYKESIELLKNRNNSKFEVVPTFVNNNK